MRATELIGLLAKEIAEARDDPDVMVSHVDPSATSGIVDVEALGGILWLRSWMPEERGRS